MERIPITKAVIYCRISSQKQLREGDGLESQRVRCEEFARYRNLTVVEIFRDARVAASHSDRAQLHAEVKLLEQQIEQLVDRIMKTESPAAMTAYENRLAALEIQKAKTADMIANCGRPLVDFDTARRTALEFL